MTAWLRDVWLIAGQVLSELRHRRSLAVVTVITVGFLALYGWGASEILSDLEQQNPGGGLPPEETARGAGFLLLGIGVFATFSLASVLAVFTTMNTIRGEAEQGLLQPLLVRPVARSAVIAGRIGAATAAGGVYAAIVISAASALTSAAGGSPPGNLLQVVLALTAAVALVAAFTVVASSFLGTAATGLTATMLISVGFFASLVRQIGEQTDSESVTLWAGRVTDLLGFNALYESALGSLTDGVGGLAGLALQLGPFGQQRDFTSSVLVLSAVELAVLVALATWRLRRLDL